MACSSIWVSGARPPKSKPKSPLPSRPSPLSLARVWRWRGISFCTVWRKTEATLRRHARQVTATLRQRMRGWDGPAELRADHFASELKPVELKKMDLRSTLVVRQTCPIGRAGSLPIVARRWRRSDKSFICQFQHLAWPLPSFLPSFRIQPTGAYGIASTSLVSRLSGFVWN